MCGTVMSTAVLPGHRSAVQRLKPPAARSYEIGTAIHMFKNRLHLDFSYYNKLNYNLTRSAAISSSSGFTSTLINYR